MRRAFAQGFTLVELMVTVAIVAILLALGLPSFQSSFWSNRIATANNELLASLALARTEAIRSTRSAGICAANAAGNACADTTAWNNGWLVWTNTNADMNFQNGTDTLVRHVQPRTSIALTVAASTATNPADNTRILFDNRGRALNTAAGGRTLQLLPDSCPQGLMLVRSLRLTPIGQVNSSQQACP